MHGINNNYHVCKFKALNIENSSICSLTLSRYTLLTYLIKFNK